MRSLAGVALLVPSISACGFFTSLDAYSEGTGGGAGSAATAGGEGGSAGEGGSGGQTADCTQPDACVLPGCKSCSGSPDVCTTNVSTDPVNCGECGHNCQGGACNGGTCQPIVLAPQRDHPAGVAVDAMRVFWLDQGSGSGGKVLSVSHTGGTVSELAIDLQSPLNLALDATTVYFTFFTGGGGIAKVGKDAQGFSSLSASSGPWAIATTDSDGAVYWASSDGTVRRMDKNGGNQITLATATGVPRGVFVDDTDVFWTEACPSVAPQCTTGSVHRASKIDGSGAVELAHDQASPMAVAVDDTHVYWINAGSSGPATCTSSDGSVVRADRADGANALVLATQQRCPQSLAVDDTRVYWTNGGSYAGTVFNGDGNVSAVPIGAGRVVVLASEQALPFGIALDASSVYWTEMGLGVGVGALKKVAK